MSSVSIMYLWYMMYYITTSAQLHRQCFVDRNNCIYLLTFRIQRIRSPPRLPPAVACSSRSCSHLVIFGDHFNQVMWDEYAAEDQMYRQQKRNDNVVLVTEVVYVFF